MSHPDTWRPAPFRTRVEDSFLPLELAESMRSSFDRLWDDPARTNFIWDSFFVDRLYAYQRTLPAKVFGDDVAAAFYRHVDDYAQTLGLRATQAFVSFYLNGQGQGCHNDAFNGTLGYVYSLAFPTDFAGGETLVARPEMFAGWDGPRRPSAGSDFFEPFAPVFNRLILFDDRLAHMVSTVQGTYDPRKSRVVVHGHFYQGNS